MKEYVLLRIGFFKWQVNIFHVVVVRKDIEISFITFNSIGD